MTPPLTSEEIAGFRLEWIEIDKLNPSVYNPRKDLRPGDPEYEMLKKSINEFGLVDPLVVNFDMTVIGGHQRLKILKEAGLKTAPCSIVNLNKIEEKILNLALNKQSGAWEYPKLKDIIVEIDTGEFDLEITGWSQEELNEVFEIIPDTNKIIDEEVMAETENECPKCGFKW